MTMCKSSKTTSLFTTATLNDSAIFELVSAYYKESRLFRSDSYFEEAFYDFLTTASESASTLSERQFPIIHLFFEAEYLFTQQIVYIIGTYSDRPLTTHDFLQLLEIIIYSNWQFPYVNRFVDTLDYLAKIIGQQLKTSPASLKKTQPSFFRHIQFLAFRFVQNENTSSGNNELYDFVQKKYPLAFEHADKLRTIIKRAFDIQLSESEVVFLTLHIKRALANQVDK